MVYWVSYRREWERFEKQAKPLTTPVNVLVTVNSMIVHESICYTEHASMTVACLPVVVFSIVAMTFHK